MIVLARIVVILLKPKPETISVRLYFNPKPIFNIIVYLIIIYAFITRPAFNDAVN